MEHSPHIEVVIKILVEHEIRIALHRPVTQTQRMPLLKSSK